MVESSGLSQPNSTWELYSIPVSPVGLAGSIKAVTVDASPFSVGFTARNANVYSVLLVRPVTVYAVVAE